MGRGDEEEGEMSGSGNPFRSGSTARFRARSDRPRPSRPVGAVLVALCAWALMPLAARAQESAALAESCPNEWLKRLRPLRPKAQALLVREVVGSHCRRFPGDGTRQVAAVVYGPPESHRGESGAQNAVPLTLVLAVLPASGASALQRYEQVIEEDAVTRIAGRNFVWDPATYRLAPDVLALGLRFHTSAPEVNCADQRWRNELSLLVPDGNTLRPVFAAAMSVQVGREGPLCRHAPAIDNHERVLVLDRQRSGGWADLLLVDRITTERADTPEGQQPAMRRVGMRWRYDGQRYRGLPQEPFVESFEETLLVKPAK